MSEQTIIIIIRKSETPCAINFILLFKWTLEIFILLIIFTIYYGIMINGLADQNYIVIESPLDARIRCISRYYSTIYSL